MDSTELKSPRGHRLLKVGTKIAPEGHRLLKVGEKIKTGDLFLFRGNWMPSEVLTEYGEVFTHEQFDDCNLYATPMETKPPSGHRLLKVGEKIKTGDLYSGSSGWHQTSCQTEDHATFVGEPSQYDYYATPIERQPVDALEFQAEPKQCEGTDAPLSEHEQIELERGLIYGDPYHNHQSIGKIWTGLLEQHYGITLPHCIPPSLVALLMAGLKINRMNRVWQQDNADDGQIYVKFASKFQKADNEQRLVQLKEEECH